MIHYRIVYQPHTMIVQPFCLKEALFCILSIWLLCFVVDQIEYGLDGMVSWDE